MKAIRVTALVALMVVAAVTVGVAGDTEHPTKTEHPTTTEHPSKAEHPGTSEHPANTEHAAAAGDIIAVASSADGFTTFVTAIEAAGLVEHLQSEGPFTVFAPTDAAFAKLPPGTVETLLKPENKAQLSALLADHVVPGRIMAADIKTMKAVNAGGHDLDIMVEDGKVTVNGANVVQTDIAASNGVIHAIDEVLLPAPAAEHPAAETHQEHPSEHPKS